MIRKKRSSQGQRDVNQHLGVKMKILQEGDHVVNIWSEFNAILVAVRHLNEEVEIFRLEADEEGLPRLNPRGTWQITFGDGEIEVSGAPHEEHSQPAYQNTPVKVTTF